MSGDVSVNPEELARFAKELAYFNRNLHESVSRLNGAFARVSETWRDEQQRKFSKEFDQMKGLLLQFERRANGHVSPLLGKAKVADDYLKHR